MNLCSYHGIYGCQECQAMPAYMEPQNDPINLGVPDRLVIANTYRPSRLDFIASLMGQALIQRDHIIDEYSCAAKAVAFARTLIREIDNNAV